jgi:hypothetical protein
MWIKTSVAAFGIVGALACASSKPPPFIIGRFRRAASSPWPWCSHRMMAYSKPVWKTLGVFL